MTLAKKLFSLPTTVVAAACLWMSGCSRTVEPAPPTINPPMRTPADGAPPSTTSANAVAGSRADNNNLLLGNPSRAGKDASNYLIERPQHAMSYNQSNGGPNWVAWHLEKSDLGNVRRGDFLPDPLLPPAWQIRPSDYRGSGYDRGHVCPSGDRTRTKIDNTATFVMSNMLPQAAALNQQVWKDLEDYSRSLVKSNELYTIAGGAGSVERIGNGKVNVPQVCWKIILVLPRGDNDLSRITADTRIIAVSMPNRQRDEIADSKWWDWITTVAQLEKTTGYDFLSALPDAIERALEQKSDPGPASAARASGRIDTGTAPIAGAPTGGETISETPHQSVAGAAQASDIQVWVNTGSGVYHFPGQRWYGQTKAGQYMSEAQARQQGYRANRGG